MLEPEYFNDKADRMLEIYRQLEDFIMHDIAERLLKSQSVSGTADRMIWKLQQMGESRAEIIKRLSQLTGLSKKELKALLQDAVMTSWNDDLQTLERLGIEVTNPLENAVVASVMNAEYIKSQRELENLTRTTMNQANQDLIRMLDEVEVRIASGVQSYSGAVCEILDNYAGKGVRIDYPEGTKRTLEAAVRMCVVTSMNQTSAQITNQYIIEGGVEYVLVSAHLGARPQKEGFPYLSGHENWQGKVYKIRGSEEGFPNLLEMTGYDIEPNGRGKVVNPLGLHGYNCRHSHKPWDKDLRNPYIDEDGNLKIDIEENRKKYELQQKQRAMERAVRKTKRGLLVKQAEIDGVAEVDVKEILQQEYDKLSYQLKCQNKEYNKFCEKNDLQTQVERLKVAGFKRKQAAKATGRARVYENWKKSLADKDEIAKDRFGIFTNNNKTNSKYYNFENKSLDTVEREISSLDYEVAVIFDDEKAINCQLGTTDEIRFTKYQLKQMKGKDVTHNHPLSTPPSPEDLYVLKNNKAKSFRTCGKNGIYVLEYSEKVERLPEYEIFDREYENILRELQQKYIQKVLDGVLTEEKALICLGEDIWEKLYNIYGIKPDFVRR